MKPYRLVLLSATLAAGWSHSPACEDYGRRYLAGQYNLFHLSVPEYKEHRTREMNIADWQRQTSRSIPAKDVEEVVYGWSCGRIDSLLGSNPDSGGNRFAEWLIKHHDKDAVNCLLLAKRSQEVRSRQNTRWYYQSMTTPEYQTLEAIQKEAEDYEGKRFADRYAFQAVRALFGKSDYKGCVDYWNKNKGKFTPGTAVYYMAEDYAEGSTQHISGEKKSYAEAFKAMPDVDWPLREISDRIFLLENTPSNDLQFPEYGKEDLPAYRELYDRILPILNDCQGPNRAQWLYAGAFIAEKLGNRDEALSLITKAANATTDPDTRDAVRVLSLYIHAGNRETYDKDFETYLYGELKWLNGMMQKGLTPERRQEIGQYGIYHHLSGFSQYYWSDAMRKVLIGKVVPLCFNSGDTIRALQYLNYADYCLFNMIEIGKDRLQYYDYANDYFLNLDSIGTKHVVALADRINHPRSDLDRFLNKGSYTDPQYLSDIIGTQYLAAMDYANAAKHLKRVSPQFNQSRRIYEYTDRNPFNEGKKQAHDPMYKLHFAQKMASLQSRIARADNPNDKAELMLEYNRAIAHSTRRCWPLTTYYEGEFCNYPYYGTRLLNAYHAMYRFTKDEDKKAFSLFTDPERAAAAYCKYGLYATAADRFPRSETVRIYQAKCDNLYDYRITARRNPREEAWYSPVKTKWDYSASKSAYMLAE